MLLVMFAVSVLVFLIFNAIPNGDPAVRMAGPEASDTQIAVIRREWGFDRSLPAQYAIRLGHVHMMPMVHSSVIRPPLSHSSTGPMPGS